jgi:hypothetical protein
MRPACPRLAFIFEFTNPALRGHPEIAREKTFFAGT